MRNLVRVQSIDRAVGIIECFSESRRELKLGDIADMMNLNKSTVHGLLNTLKYHGFIEQDEHTQKYRLGIRLISLGELVVNSLNIPGIAYPVIESICEKTEETVHIAMLDGSDVVYIGKKECNKSIKTTTKIGSRIPAYFTADGKVILSHLDEERLDDIIPQNIDRLTPFTITDRQKLVEVLKEVRNKGYSVDYEETIQGLICVAAPIFDYTGAVKYSISTTGPALRMTEDKIEEYIKIITKAALEISQRIGYRG